MTPEQVEYVARAFYEAEHRGDWEGAPGGLQQRFRDLARLAIATLNREIRNQQTMTFVVRPDPLLMSS